MADDVHGRDVGGKDHNAGDGDRGALRGFAEGFDDFFDAAFEGLVLGRWGELACA